jgi:hypothetical protein|tara:strand:- start:10562 stop:10726 length:165 start_codon:yes stop_codon:yes gene_type:complete
MISIKQIRENLIEPAIGHYYDKHIEPKILAKMTPEQRATFSSQPKEELIKYPFD